MARGLPGVWSTVLSIPFLASGAIIYFGDTPSPELLGAPLLVFGAFVVAMGWYVHLVAAPPEPRLRDEEEIIDTRHPTQKAPLAKVGLSLPFLFAAGFLMFFTTQPYVYPMGAFVVGLYLLSTGILTYWTNSLTTYYITTERVINSFRLLSLVRKEVPMEKIRAVRESKSPIESLVGVGNIRVASGGGAGLEIVIRNVNDATAFADELRGTLKSDG
ncbi:PH domain-containing protein [Halorussus litoreus]|uniref:PH domain-containing protein n=1 Tax=Halorussus litoreus TaxID=1710536 RepID=UPI000E260B66|nr:PH domain-containing protein [Halorussus litoreus]